MPRRGLRERGSGRSGLHRCGESSPSLQPIVTLGRVRVCRLWDRGETSRSRASDAVVNVVPADVPQRPGRVPVEVDAVAVVVIGSASMSERTWRAAPRYWTTVFPLAESGAEGVSGLSLQHVPSVTTVLAGLGVRPGQDDGAPADLSPGVKLANSRVVVLARTPWNVMV